MLKHLIQNGYVNVQKMLLNNYTRLNLNETEVVIVLKLFEMLKNNQISITVSQLAKKTAMSHEDLSNVLSSLYDKNLLSISVIYTNQGKSKETFNLDNLINEMELLMKSDMDDQVLSQNENTLKQAVSLVEDAYKRNLSTLELEMIREWISSGETLDKIRKALAVSVKRNKLNIKYTDRVLANQDDDEDVHIDEENSKLMAEFYRNIK